MARCHKTSPPLRMPMDHVKWKCSTIARPWADLVPVEFTSGAADICVEPDVEFQEILGWGGCFNEKGWEAISVLSAGDRAALLRELFVTCGFNVCRVPIGANDFACSFYSLNESPGDLAMEHFNIERDCQRLIPFIQAAIQYQPGLRIWGSPWSPPKWLKTTNAFTFGELKSDHTLRDAYALYFAKFVKAYRREGIDVFAVMPQNEPCWNNRDYPACGYDCDSFVSFVKNHLIPVFTRESLDCEVWLGTMVDSQYGDISLGFDYIERLIGEPIGGVGCQYGVEMMRKTRANFPRLRLMQTETDCGNGTNDWAYARQQFDSIRAYLEAGANYYMLWNMVLDETGASVAGWRQSTPITVHRSMSAFEINPQLTMVKHFSAFVKPGARRVAATGGESIAFKNPNGEVLLVLQNSDDSDREMSVNIGGAHLCAALPSRSWSTFVYQQTESLETRQI